MEAALIRLSSLILSKKGILDLRSLTILLSGSITQEVVFLLRRGLQEGVVDKHMLLVETFYAFSIPTDKSRMSYLIVIGQALQSGANSNINVEPRIGSGGVTVTRGKMHFIVLVYWLLQVGTGNAQKRLEVNVLLSMLIASGANLNAPYSGTRSDITVEEWIKKEERVLPNLEDPKIKKWTAIFLNKPTLLKEKVSQEDTEFIIRSFANSITIEGEKRIGWTVYLINEEYFEKLLLIGATIDYLIVTLILITMDAYRRRKLFAVAQEYHQMLLDVALWDVPIDCYQLDYYRSINHRNAETLKVTFQQPKWKKYCRIIDRAREERIIGETITDYIRQLSYNLAIDPNKEPKQMCEAIRKVVRASPEAIRNARASLHTERLNAELGDITKYLPGQKAPILRCKSTITYVNEIDVLYYRDNEGNIWCFDRDSFDLLLRERRNYHTGKLLPPEFLEQVKFRSDLIKKLKLKKGSVTEAVTEMRAPQVISNKKTKAINAKFTAAAVSKHIPTEKIKSLKAKDFEAILKEVGFPVDNLSLAPDALALSTFAFITVSSNEDRIKKIFELVKNR